MRRGNIPHKLDGDWLVLDDWIALMPSRARPLPPRSASGPRQFLSYLSKRAVTITV
jgi:hypothetical protein